MTRADIQAVIDRIPQLGDFGIGVFDNSKPDRGLLLKIEQEAYSDSADACSRICDWLSTVERTGSADRGMSSYALKHVAEAAIGYVTNGQFIAAAVHSGFPFRIIPHSPNVLIGIGRRSLRLDSSSV